MSKKNRKDDRDFREEDLQEEVTDTVSATPPAPQVPETFVKLNFGCGFRKLPGYINIDIREEVKPDVCDDVMAVLKSYSDSSVDEIRAFDFMEHVRDPIPLMKEIHRVLKVDGVFHFFIPSTDGRGAFMDPTHVSFWNINTWLYYYDPDWQGLYPDLPKFKLVELRDIVSSEKLRIVHTEGKVSPKK